MSNPEYDKEKFWIDSYGNLIPKKKIKGITADEAYGKWIKENKDKLDNTTNVKILKGK